MAHPFIGSSPSTWDARSIDLDDADPVTLWEPILNGSDFVQYDTPVGQLDIDGVDGEAGIDMAPGDSDEYPLESDSAFATDGGSWTLHLRFEYSSTDSPWDIVLQTRTQVGGGDGWMAINSSGVWVLYNANLGDVYTFGSALTPDSVSTVTVRYDAAADEIDVFVDGVKDTTTGPLSCTAYPCSQLQLGGADSGLRWQVVGYLPVALSDSQVATLEAYHESIDGDYSGGVTRNIVYEDIEPGSHVVAHETSHPHRWLADFEGQNPADLAGTSLLFSTIVSSSQVDHYLWFTWNGAGSDPAHSGRTGHVVAGVTGDDMGDVVAKAVTVLDAITGCSATQESELFRVENTEHGQVDPPPSDVDTTADVDEIAEGGTSETTIGTIASTTGAAPSIPYVIVSRPRDARSFFCKPGVKTWETITTAIGMAGIQLPAGALQRRDRVYLNP